jgi:sugar phosphate isomerase/epimerase
MLIPIAMTSCAREQEKGFIGLQLYSVRGDMNEDPVSTIEAVGAMGYKFIETASYRDGLIYGMSPEDFRELVESNGMTFLSAHVMSNLPDENNWDETMAWWDECIDAHVRAGAKYIVQPAMGGFAYESLENLHRFCKYFEAIGERCNARGIRFGFHNHARVTQELEGEVIYDYMLKNTDPDKVMFQMDVHWIHRGGADPVYYFNKYPGRFETLHIKDEAEIGRSGEMDFEYIFTNMGKAGTKYIIVEVEQYNYEPLESARVSLEYLLNADYVNF